MAVLTISNLQWSLATLARKPANLPDKTFGAPVGYAYFDIFNTGSRSNNVRMMSRTVRDSGQDELCFSFWYETSVAVTVVASVPWRITFLRLVNIFTVVAHFVGLLRSELGSRQACEYCARIGPIRRTMTTKMTMRMTRESRL